MRQKILRELADSLICRPDLEMSVSMMASLATVLQARRSSSSLPLGYSPHRFFQNSARRSTASFLVSSVPGTPAMTVGEKEVAVRIRILLKTII